MRPIISTLIHCFHPDHNPFLLRFVRREARDGLPASSVMSVAMLLAMGYAAPLWI